MSIGLILLIYSNLELFSWWLLFLNHNNNNQRFISHHSIFHFYCEQQVDKFFFLLKISIAITPLQEKFQIINIHIFLYGFIIFNRLKSFKGFQNKCLVYRVIVRKQRPPTYLPSLLPLLHSHTISPIINILHLCNLCYAFGTIDESMLIYYY